MTILFAVISICGFSMYESEKVVSEKLDGEVQKFYVVKGKTESIFCWTVSKDRSGYLHISFLKNCDTLPLAYQEVEDKCNCV